MATLPGRLLAAAVVLALIAGACGGSAATGAPTTEPAVSPTGEAASAPPPTPSPGPTASPTSTPEPVSTPVPTPTPVATTTPAPSPTPPAAKVNAVWTWVLDKPLVLRGKAGTTTWNKVMFTVKTTTLKWKATPTDGKGCTFRYTVESKALPKTVKSTTKIKGSKAATGTKALAVRYGDAKVVVNSDCASWSLTFTVGSRPDVKITKSTAFKKVTGTTAAELNLAMYDKSDVDLDWRSNTKYYAPARVTSHTVSVGIDYEIPKWTPPEGTDPELVKAWNKAVSGMRRHLEGYAAISVQAAGRYIESATKTTFASTTSMNAYYRKLSGRQMDLAEDRADAYAKNTEYGDLQGAYIP